MTRKADKILLVVILIACGSVMFRNLDSLSIRMWDESRNAINAIEMLSNHNPLVVYYDGSPDLWNTKPPLLVWCMAGSMKLFGINELSVRLPSAIAALITSLVIILLLYKYTNGSMYSMIGGVALVTFPGFVDYHIARNGDFDSLLVMWTFLSAVFYFIWITNKSKENVYLYLSVLAIAGGVLTKSVAALMVVPGFMAFTILKGELRRIFRFRVIIYSLLLFVVPVLGYYVLREFASPGYLNAVLNNELSGRYLDVQEGHNYSTWFYFTSLIDSRLGIWIYVLPVAVIAYFWKGKSKPVGDLVLFGLVNAISFLVIITTSKTKLPWYDAPVFPFIAVVCAGGLLILVEYLESKFNIKFQERFTKFRFVVVLLLIVFPIVKIHSTTSVKATFEQTYPELFYGDMIKAFYKSHTGEKLTVVYDDYNSHALFYIKSFQKKGEKIITKNTSDRFEPGELILTCENSHYDKIKNNYKMQTVYRNENRIISRVIEKLYLIKYSIPKELEKLYNDQVAIIYANEDWISSIRTKSVNNGVSIDVQVRFDAIYILEMENKITPEEGQLLKSVE